MLPLSSLEVAIGQAFPVYALEQLRRRLLHSATTDHTAAASARAVVQMAYDTEIQAVLRKAAPMAPGIAEETVPTRRRYINIDDDMVSNGFLVEPALQALEAEGVLPTHYVEMVRSFWKSLYPKYRTSALSAIVCFAAAFYAAKES